MIIKGQIMDTTGRARNWTDRLSDEDLAFVKRFVLASGSLKGLAQAYGISYPTVRLRLDRLIEKIKILDSQEVSGEFERLVRVLHAEGRVQAADVARLLAVHHQEMEGTDASSDSDR
jgi:hypothetical protein